MRLVYTLAAAWMLVGCRNTIKDGGELPLEQTDVEETDLPDETDPVDTDPVITDAETDTDPSDTDPTDTDAGPTDTGPTDTDAPTDDSGPVGPADADGDGFPADVDCDDASNLVFPGAEEVPYDGVDGDCDPLTPDDDLDGDRFDAIVDCDDLNVAINPAAGEIAYDGIDNDCDAASADDDADRDGYGLVDDCDDTDFLVNPGAAERCNGVDDDCNGGFDDAIGTLWYADTDGDGFGDPADAFAACDGVSGRVADATDCDDTDGDTRPGAPERCDGRSNDCDADVDEDPIDGTFFFRDGDGDGAGDGRSAAWACEAPAGFVETNDDCDDLSNAVHPGASESCNDVDDDCNRLIDDAALDARWWYADADRDGSGDAAEAVLACDAPFGAVEVAGDCDDRDRQRTPGAAERCDAVDNDCDEVIDEEAIDPGTFFSDVDRDGFGDPDAPVLACVAAEGVVAEVGDCDDLAPSTHIGATELCDGADNDCDGVRDEGAVGEGTWFRDGDGDGFGDPADAVVGCERPEGYVATALDCDDENPSINPDGDELCGGGDEDCDGTVDEADAVDAGTWWLDADGDGFGGALASTRGCLAPPRYVSSSDDCADGDDRRHPDAEERCNGVDDDCDADVDNGAVDQRSFFVDGDGDGYGGSTSTRACQVGPGLSTQSTDCDDATASVNPGAAELCNGVDDDCRQGVDLPLPADAEIAWFDADGDGFAGELVSQRFCEAPAGWYATATDCDDTAWGRKPGGNERCNGLDDNCNTEIDEGAVDMTAWYGDGDGDGFGAGTASIACDAGPNEVALDGDCDDTQADARPGGVEVCDDLDNDCDGTTDGVDALDVRRWFTDGDADGYGTADYVQACDPPAGTAGNDRDCDDLNLAVNPAATEVCNRIDDDCDGEADDEDSRVSGGSTWYIDADEDGYGAARFAREACVQPAGYVADATDCNDLRGDANPSGTEVCDGIDNDCDRTADESSAVDAPTWYADRDDDGYGNDAATQVSCVAPADHVDVGGDCDDTSAARYPGNREIADFLDNDCDVNIDEDLFLGTGRDGAIAVTGEVILTQQAIAAGRTRPDAVNFRVTGMSTDTLVANTTVQGIAAGDEVIIVNLHGTATEHSSVGAWEFATVQSVTGVNIRLTKPISEVYGEVSNTNLTGQDILVQRVPHYTDVTVSAAGRLTTHTWNGQTGGLLAFRASGTVSVAAGGVIHADARGYNGGSTGPGGPNSNCDSYQGWSWAGTPIGGVCGSYNEAIGAWRPNFGGGGAHITGGGGEYGGGATPGDSWTGGSASPPQAGLVYGFSDLSALFYGSGGGGVWNGSEGPPGPGGNGGGLVFVAARALDLDGAKAISARGGSTPYWARGTWTYGAGGGAGGTVWLVAHTVDAAANAIDAIGGLGERTHIRLGGNGGVGRVRLDYGAINGVAFGQAGAGAAVQAASQPDAGWSIDPY